MACLCYPYSVQVQCANQSRFLVQVSCNAKGCFIQWMQTVINHNQAREEHMDCMFRCRGFLRRVRSRVTDLSPEQKAAAVAVAGGLVAFGAKALLKHRR